MGVVEMAFTVSTGETDYTITVIEDCAPLPAPTRPLAACRA